MSTHPDFARLRELLAEGTEFCPLPWQAPSEGCLCDASDQIIDYCGDSDRLIVAAVNALPWLMREVEGGE